MLNNDRAPSDTELAERIRARDAHAFELLFARYQEALARHLAGFVRSEPEPDATAQDLLQEVFLRVWTRAEQWSGQGSLKGWLYRIATNLALNHLRSARRHPWQPLANEDESQWDEWAEEEVVNAPGWLVDASALGPDELLEQRELRASLHEAAGGLSPEKREVFRLVHELELSIHDAAGRLGIPEGTVKSRLHYANKQFGQAWRDPDSCGEE